MLGLREACSALEAGGEGQQLEWRRAGGVPCTTEQGRQHDKKAGVAHGYQPSQDEVQGEAELLWKHGMSQQCVRQCLTRQAVP